MADPVHYPFGELPNLSEEDRTEWLNVINDALIKYDEREAQYHTLWKQDEASTHALAALAKAKRLAAVLGTIERDPEADMDYLVPGAEDDGVDLINYAVFAVIKIRKMRGGV